MKMTNRSDNRVKEVDLNKVRKAMQNLPQGTRIRMNDDQPLPGVTGTIVGRCTEGQPVIGPSYIIRPDDPSLVNCDQYPYDFFSAFECMFTVVDDPIVPRVAFIEVETTVKDFMEFWRDEEDEGVEPTQEDYENFCFDQARAFFIDGTSDDNIQLR